MSAINLLIRTIIEQMLGTKWKISFACLSLCLFLLSPVLLKYFLAVRSCFSFSFWPKSQPWLIAQYMADRLLLGTAHWRRRGL